MAKYVKKPIPIEAEKTDISITIHTLEGDMIANPGDYIITGVKGESYPCKPDVFEMSYEQVDDNYKYPCYDFGWALSKLKQGKKLKRKGWNGKNQYIFIVDNLSYKDSEGNIINPIHDVYGNKAIAFFGTSGIQVGWLASQADMLAEDWEIVE